MSRCRCVDILHKTQGSLRVWQQTCYLLFTVCRLVGDTQLWVCPEVHLAICSPESRVLLENDNWSWECQNSEMSVFTTYHHVWAVKPHWGWKYFIGIFSLSLSHIFFLSQALLSPVGNLQDNVYLFVSPKMLKFTNWIELNWLNQP